MSSERLVLLDHIGMLLIHASNSMPELLVPT